MNRFKRSWSNRFGKAKSSPVISTAMGKAVLSPGGDEPVEDDEGDDGDE